MPPALGCPKPIRNQYRADGNWQTYTRDFLKYLQTQEASSRELVKIAQATPACLVCFEADYATCHRTYVARAARQFGGPTVTHLTAKTTLPDLVFSRRLRRINQVELQPLVGKAVSRPSTIE